MSKDDTTMNTGRATALSTAYDTDEHPGQDRPPAGKGGGRSGLTPTQVLASALAAATSTFALSYFGVVGTIAGAAMGSVVTVLGNEIYSRSIRKTTETVNKIAPAVVPVRDAGRRAAVTRPLPRVPGGMPPPPPPPPPPGAGSGHRDSTAAETAASGEPTAETTTLRTVTDATVVGGNVPARAAAAGAPPPPAPPAPPGPLGRLTARFGRGKVLIASCVVVFIAILGTVLLIELGTGKPLSDTVRGRDGSGTTLFDGTGTGSGAGADPTESPSEQSGDDPASPPAEDDATPSPEPSESPSEPPQQDSSPTPTEPEPDEEPAPEPEPDSPEPEAPGPNDGDAGGGPETDTESGSESGDQPADSTEDDAAPPAQS